MLNSLNGTPLTKNPSKSHPNFISKEDKAKQIHRLLLDLAKDESERELKSVCRQTADFFREMFYGFTPAKIKSKIFEAFRDYFDGEDYTPLEINNIAELTGISEDDLQPVIDKMVKKGELLEGKRRRHNEAGNHFNAIYKPRI